MIRRVSAGKKGAITAAVTMGLLIGEYAVATPALKVEFRPKRKDLVASRILKNIHKKITIKKSDFYFAFGPPYSKPFFFG